MSGPLRGDRPDVVSLSDLYNPQPPHPQHGRRLTAVDPITRLVLQGWIPVSVHQHEVVGGDQIEPDTPWSRASATMPFKMNRKTGGEQRASTRDAACMQLPGHSGQAVCPQDGTHPPLRRAGEGDTWFPGHKSGPPPLVSPHRPWTHRAGRRPGPPRRDGHQSKRHSSNSEKARGWARETCRY